MFDFGWQEFMMIAFVLVLVVGPKDLPKVLRGFTKLTNQAKQMAREFTRSLEDAAEDSNIKDVKKMVTDLKTGNLEDMAKIVDAEEIKSGINQMKNDMNVASIGEDVKSIQDAEKSAEKNTSDQDK